jgi:uncharacterized protein YukE
MHSLTSQSSCPICIDYGRTIHIHRQSLSSFNPAAPKWFVNITQAEGESTMAYQKRTASPAVKTAKVRIAGLKSIPKLKLIEGMSLERYEEALRETEQKIADYNTALANINQMKRDAGAAEKTLAEISERMLSLIAGQFGKSSDEYEKAGGKRRIPGARRTKKSTKNSMPNPKDGTETA